tara:strand:- start:357 stop:665 length:309 start_codon:yes stop_codon:yes gene_type:complete
MSTTVSALCFTRTRKDLTVTALRGHALSRAVTVKVYGKSLAAPSGGVQQNLPVWSLADGVTIPNVAPGIPPFHVSFTVSGGGAVAGGGGVNTASFDVILKQS